MNQKKTPQKTKTKEEKEGLPMVTEDQKVTNLKV